MKCSKFHSVESSCVNCHDNGQGCPGGDEHGRILPKDNPTKGCPSCGEPMCEGMVLYACEVCGKDCCSQCSDTCKEKSVVCDDCIAGGYEDGYRQSRDMKSYVE